MAQTVLITGSSTGIGKATAKHFRDQGWNVVATMRTPERETELKDAGNVMLARLDVTDADSIQAAIDAGLARFGRIDAVVNNAGYGLTGSFESMTLERIRRQFETNVFGLMEVTRRILPHFRAHKAGTVINVASMGGRLTFPFYSVYHATKWAVDGFSESLQFELRPLGIRVKIVEPGAIKTDFYDRSVDLAHDRALSEYNALVDKAMRRMNRRPGHLPRRHRRLVAPALPGRQRCQEHAGAAPPAAGRRLAGDDPPRAAALSVPVRSAPVNGHPVK
jgi:NAD(P)-dependent dehydrogenase (short-subunit alcohol dehydrogenase family)